MSIKSLGEGDSRVCSNEVPFNSHKVEVMAFFSSLNEHCDNHMCLFDLNIFLR